MERDHQIDIRNLRSDIPLPGVRKAREELEAFPRGILNTDEMELIAAAQANLEEVENMAIRKGIELELPDRRAHGTLLKSDPRILVQPEKYQGMDLKEIVPGVETIASGRGWTLTHPSLAEIENLIVASHYFLPRSFWGNAEINGRHTIRVPEEKRPDTAIQIRLRTISEREKQFVFVIGRWQSDTIFSFKKIAAYKTTEPTDGVDTNYMRLTNNERELQYYLRFLPTGKKDTIDVTLLKALEKPTDYLPKN